jgi:predicted nucleic acid-binding protein
MGRKIIHYLLDTNALVRYLVRDEENQYQQVVGWFKEAEAGKIRIIIPAIVVAETCFVLESFYKKPRHEIGDSMVVFLSQRWMTVPDRDILLSLWDNFKNGLHFVDSFLVAWAEKDKYQLMTFDKKLPKRLSSASPGV